MAIICNVYFSTRDFSYSNKTFVAEASDFGHKQQLSGRVYDDACDEGFILVSHITGEATVFALDREEKTADGDEIAGWRYKAIAKSRPNFAGQWIMCERDFTVLIIND